MFLIQNAFVTGKKSTNTLNYQLNEKENNTTGKKTVIDKTKFKTEMCKNWIEKQQCNYGDKCKFAHGKLELNEKIIQEKEKYKSKKCQSFYTKGYCLYGVKCLFKHEDRKLKEILKQEEKEEVVEEEQKQLKRQYSLLLDDDHLQGQGQSSLLLDDQQAQGQSGLHQYLKHKLGDSIKNKLKVFRDIKTKHSSATHNHHFNHIDNHIQNNHNNNINHNINDNINHNIHSSQNNLSSVSFVPLMKSNIVKRLIF